LADGTIVWLNSDSKLRYPVDFNTDERRVFLSGEAYFEVAHNANKPFIVDVEDSKIKVLGTSFNVRAYDIENKVVATLVTGSVKMNTKSKNQVIMFPGEQCVVNEKGDLDKRKVDVSLFTSWKDGRLKFKHQTLEEIMNTLYRWYDIEVVYENISVKDIYYSGNVKRYDDFENVIKLLEMAGTIKCSVKGKKVYIKEIKR
jgi:ferric-dicitrate binding protein FerR (iron transport regulator)